MGTPLPLAVLVVMVIAIAIAWNWLGTQYRDEEITVNDVKREEMGQGRYQVYLQPKGYGEYLLCENKRQCSELLPGQQVRVRICNCKKSLWGSSLERIVRVIPV